MFCLNLGENVPLHQHLQIQTSAHRQIFHLFALQRMWLGLVLISFILSLCSNLYYFLKEEYLASDVLVLSVCSDLD